MDRAVVSSSSFGQGPAVVVPPLTPAMVDAVPAGRAGLAGLLSFRLAGPSARSA